MDLTYLKNLHPFCKLDIYNQNLRKSGSLFGSDRLTACNTHARTVHISLKDNILSPDIPKALRYTLMVIVNIVYTAFRGFLAVTLQIMILMSRPNHLY